MTETSEASTACTQEAQKTKKRILRRHQVLSSSAFKGVFLAKEGAQEEKKKIVTLFRSQLAGRVLFYPRSSLSYCNTPRIVSVNAVVIYILLPPVEHVLDLM